MTVNTIHFNNESFSSSGVIEYIPHSNEFHYKFTIESGLIIEFNKHIDEWFYIGDIKFKLMSGRIDLCGAEFMAIGKIEIK
jgi:hypothetical protein